VDSESVAESLGISRDNAKDLLNNFVEQKRSFPSIAGVATYLHKLEDDVFISNLYPQIVLPIESVGIIPVEEEDKGKALTDIPTADLVEEEEESAKDAVEEVVPSLSLETHLNEINRLL